MTENAKTITFVVIGLAAIVIGLATRPSAAEIDEDTLVGENLTKKFDSPDVAKRLKIVRVDEDTATPRDFEVAEQDGLWSIPSKEGYPADAAQQMAAAATSLMERKILQVVSKNAADHEQYGVIDPLSPKLEVGQKGIGTRVTMSDADNKPLVDLIVGKPVRDAEGQRYVREAGRDVVYIIEIDPAKLSTNFEDWIEKDLLKLNGWDLDRVEIKDYSAELMAVMTPDGQFGIQVAWDPRTQMTVGYDEKDAKWNPIKLQKYESKGKEEEGTYADFKLADDEELNTETLNGLKTALDDLQIADVVRKPKGLSEDLKAGQDFLANSDAKKDLRSKGFAAVPMQPGGPDEIVSSDGEVIATTKDGVEYVLRFGNLTDVTGAGEDKDKSPEKTADGADEKANPVDAAKKKSGDDVHRYLFVMARLDKNAIKQPELQPLPDLPAKKDAAPATPAATPPANPADKPAGETPAAPDAEKAKEAPAPAADAAAADKAKEADAQKAADKPADAAANPATPPAEPAKDAAAPADAKAAEAEAKDAAAPADKAPADDKELENIMAARAMIEAENKKKVDEYQARLKKGEEAVKDLNLRFGDWYFVVNDDVFTKIRLSSDKVIKKKDKPKPEASPADGKAAPLPGTGIPGLPEIPGATK